MHLSYWHRSLSSGCSRQSAGRRAGRGDRGRLRLASEGSGGSSLRYLPGADAENPPRGSPVGILDGPLKDDALTHSQEQPFGLRKVQCLDLITPEP